MILIGQYDSPFVRRVGIAMTIYRMEFEHRPWSVFGDADRLRAVNPLTRVPTLVLDDGDVLTDSHLILDYLDSRAETPLLPRAEPARHRVLRVVGLACGLADKAVSLFYERRLHDLASPIWTARCETQIAAVLQVLEAERAKMPGPFWFGPTISHADVALACAWRFVNESHPGLVKARKYRAIAATTAAMESLAVFQQISQRFVAPT